jgi:hypothetical protein
MSQKKDTAYMETGSAMKSAIAEYVEAARAIELDDQRIAQDVVDALDEANIKISSASID